MKKAIKELLYKVFLFGLVAALFIGQEPAIFKILKGLGVIIFIIGLIIASLIAVCCCCLLIKAIIDFVRGGEDGDGDEPLDEKFEDTTDETKQKAIC